jgi:hypothetical protein
MGSEPERAGISMRTGLRLKQVLSPDSKRCVFISEADVGNLFRFEEEAYVNEDGYEYGPHWKPTHISGLYASPEEAWRAAHLEIPWLRDADSN